MCHRPDVCEGEGREGKLEEQNFPSFGQLPFFLLGLYCPTSPHLVLVSETKLKINKF